MVHENWSNITRTTDYQRLPLYHIFGAKRFCFTGKVSSTIGLTLNMPHHNYENIVGITIAHQKLLYIYPSFYFFKFRNRIRICDLRPIAS